MFDVTGVGGVLNFFFFNDTATTEIYTLSLHDALPIFETIRAGRDALFGGVAPEPIDRNLAPLKSRVKEADRKSTRLNSSHANISYAVFCLKKKKLLSAPIAGYADT